MSSAAYREANREAIRDRDAIYRKANRERLRAESPKRNRRFYEAHAEQERERCRLKARAAYAANPERERARQRSRPPEAHRERARRRYALLQGATVEPIDRAAIIARDESTCYLCGLLLEPEAVQLDHVVPLSRGGAHAAANLSVACGPCNLRKGRRLLEELATDRGTQ